MAKKKKNIKNKGNDKKKMISNFPSKKEEKAVVDGVVEYEMVQTLLNATSEQLLAQELLQVVKRYIREAEK